MYIIYIILTRPVAIYCAKVHLFFEKRIACMEKKLYLCIGLCWVYTTLAQRMSLYVAGCQRKR